MRTTIETADMDNLITLLLFASLVSPTSCLPNGAPGSACESLVPSHGAATQTSGSPYELVLNDFQVQNGIIQYVPGVSYTGKGMIMYTY